MNGMALVNIGRLIGMPKVRTDRERSPFGRRMHLSRKSAGLTQMQVRERLGVSQGTISDAELMGQSSGKVAEFAALYHVDAVWLATGEGEAPTWWDQAERQDWTPSQPAPTGVIVSPVAQDSSHPKFEDAPTTVAWERILIDPLKPEFQTTMPDASMEPDIPRGARVIFITGAEPVPGDWVLCADSDSNLYLREMRQLRPGRWEAHALNQAFLPLDSERDGLRVVAVFDGVRGRKGRV